MTNILIAGFGGQGILFAGKIIATAGMLSGKQVSWLPSYGPEMRGGTANCAVCIDDDPISCPMVTKPNILIAMNKPAYRKFIHTVRDGGQVFYDSSLIDSVVERAQVQSMGFPATALADEKGLSGLANMILLGKVFQETPLVDSETIRHALEHCIPPQKAHLLELNLQALQLGKTQSDELRPST